MNFIVHSIVLMSKVQCVLRFEICTKEGRGEEKGGSAIFKTNHPEPLTSEIIPPQYVLLSTHTDH